MLVARFLTITNHVRAYHTQGELLTVADRILRLAGRPNLTVLEAGAGKGASTAKLSLVTRMAGGCLLVCDSFRGMPPNDEVQRHLDGRTARFRPRAFGGTLASVQRTVARFGAPEVCDYVKGWFDATLPALTQPFDVVLLDVDLVASTRTCLRALYPRMRPGGVLFSQDGHLRETVDMLADPRFWQDEVGVVPPRVYGLGRAKLIEIVVPGRDDTPGRASPKRHWGWSRRTTPSE